jgi:hypothetical protein
MSFGILRTNVGLTTNIKIVIDSKSGLFLDSINSLEALENNKFKKFRFNKESYYDDIIPIFWKNTPEDIAFYINNFIDDFTMGSDFNRQYENIYNQGARNIINNKDYSEEYEYFAPLYLEDNKIPQNFIIFRVDGPGISQLNRKNFRQNILNELKVVSVFDLTPKTNIGFWLNKNFINNPYFRDNPLDISFKRIEFSKWNGIDITSGGYTSKSILLEKNFEKEQEIFGLEKFIFDGFKNNKLVMSNILNMTFLFDDTPSTPDIKRKWSINRYYGLYIEEMELVTSISPLTPPPLRDDFVILEQNIIFSITNPDNPFLGEWKDGEFFIEYKNNFYPVERYSEEVGEGISEVQDDGFIAEEYTMQISFIYQIISDIDLSGKQDDINKNIGYIEGTTIYSDNGVGEGENFDIDNFDDADIWLIEIDSIYHRLVKDSDGIKLKTDWEFTRGENFYEYKRASISKKVIVEFGKDIVNNRFKIYRLNFSDIKDFDTRIIDTEYSKFEYEEVDKLTNTDESKMYLENLSVEGFPKPLDDFIVDDKVVNIPVSSEYTANFETFKVSDLGLSKIWRLNPVYSRWVYKNSLSANDYPYPLNNSLIFERFNRTTNIFNEIPKRVDRNLDYFYTIGSDSNRYKHHSLHVERYLEGGDIDDSFRFVNGFYLNKGYSEDYFDYIFKQKSQFDKSAIKGVVKKYSKFNKGDSKSITNTTLFRGIEFRIYQTDSVIKNGPDFIEKINISNTNEFSGWKFSIILNAGDNGMRWDIIDDWRMNKQYNTGDIVMVDDILYISTTSSIVDNPEVEIDGGFFVKSSPHSLTASWDLYIPIEKSIFWNPNTNYEQWDYVYNNGEYYYVKNISSGVDFWNPVKAYGDPSNRYNEGDKVLYKGEYYESVIDNNTNAPNVGLNKLGKREFDLFVDDITKNNIVERLPDKFWKKIKKPEGTKWELVPVWNPSVRYFSSTSGVKYYVIHKDILYDSDSNVAQGVEPGVDPIWNRRYSISPDSNYTYRVGDNQIIKLNNRFYALKNNILGARLDSGIKININKKWKNILISIEINDGTLPDLEYSVRDNMYNDIFGKLTAYNFIKAINDLGKKYGFSNHLEYVIIEEDGQVNRYNLLDGIENLPYIIYCFGPDRIEIDSSALSKTFFNPNINANKRLNNGVIDDKEKLNWFNQIPIAYRIENINLKRVKFVNYNSMAPVSDSIFRYSGQYSPLFRNIQLFSTPGFNQKSGNYKFDTDLSYFGVDVERKIRKVNRNRNILKLRNSRDDVSQYPMLDEFGYTTTDFFIFMSNWDRNYYIETVDNKARFIGAEDIPIEQPSDVGQPISIKTENVKKYNL